MNKQSLKFFYRFTKDQRRGVVALFVLIFVFQALYFIAASIDFRITETKSAEEQEWLSMQGRINELKSRSAVKEEKIYPFNPNFISDYKGYRLGMTTDQIDRLHAYRAKGMFVNTAAEFQVVTKIHDTLLRKIDPYFKFPEFKKAFAVEYNNSKVREAESTLPKIDINLATEEDLVKARGIGPAYAQMILRQRNRLGGFVSLEQLSDFKELSADVINSLSQIFEIKALPQVNLINVNTASLNQLSHFPYFTKSIARGILTKRSMKGKINSIEELLEINDFPVEKKKIIALYLKF